MLQQRVLVVLGSLELSRMEPVTQHDFSAPVFLAETMLRELPLLPSFTQFSSHTSVLGSPWAFLLLPCSAPISILRLNFKLTFFCVLQLPA